MEETGNLVQSEGATSDILAPNTRSLVAIAAAASLNCQRCLNYLVPAALQSGVLEEEVQAAISVVEQIRRHAAGFTDKVVTDLLLGQGVAGEPKEKCC